jgi:hypothetical protein
MATGLALVLPVGMRMSIANLLILTALAEAPLGITLLVTPSLVTGLLLGVSLDSPAALVVGRVAGVALLALGLACWLTRDDARSRAARGLVAALLLYNGATIALLLHAGTGLQLAGVLLWPAVGVHAALAALCVACLRRGW